MKKLEIVAFAAIFALCVYFLVKVTKGINSFSNHVTQSVMPKAEFTLKPQEQERVIMTGHHVSIVTRDVKGNDEVKTEYVPNTVNVTLEKDGSIQVVNKEFGLALEPQLGLGYSDGLRATVGLKFAYFDRLGLDVGLSLRTAKVADPKVYLALQYAAFSNTSLFVGLDNSKHVLGGIQVKL